MKPDPHKMTAREIDIFLVTEVSHIKEDIKEVKDYFKEQPDKCGKVFVSDRRAYGIVFKGIGLFFAGITALCGLVFLGVKYVAIAVALM